MNLRDCAQTETQKRLNPHVYGHQMPQERSVGSESIKVAPWHPDSVIAQIQRHRSLLNKTETRYRELLLINGIDPLLQAITLRLDPPFKSYRPDLAYVDSRGGLVLVEVKGPHRFKEKGIAKAALAAKTYPQFRFELAEWQNRQWKVTVLSS